MENLRQEINKTVLSGNTEKGYNTVTIERRLLQFPKICDTIVVEYITEEMIAMKLKKYTVTVLMTAALTGCLTSCEKIEDAVPADITVPDVSLNTMGTLSAISEHGQESVSESIAEYETETASPEKPNAETANSEENTELSQFVEVGGDVDEPPENPEEITSGAPVEVESISLSTYSVELQVGQCKMPIVTMLPENASDKGEIWTSSDTNVAVVNELGNITAVSEGNCIVTVTSAQNPSVSADVEVTVTAGAELTYFSGILVVNKTYALPADYAPGVNAEAQAAFDEMQADAAAEGLNIYISSGFRSYDYQAGLYQRYVDKDGKEEADRYSARPGHSEHQTGLAFDLNSIDESFANTKEGKWVLRNCYKYGFIIRYPADKEDITGYKWEPWHIRYLGKETAQSVYDSGLCLEEYLGITSQYAE